MLAWESCDHAAPVVENDRIRTEVTVLEKQGVTHGALLKLRARSWTARVDSEKEDPVLDWVFWVWSA